MKISLQILIKDSPELLKLMDEFKFKVEIFLSTFYLLYLASKSNHLLPLSLLAIALINCKRNFFSQRFPDTSPLTLWSTHYPFTTVNGYALIVNMSEQLLGLTGKVSICYVTKRKFVLPTRVITCLCTTPYTIRMTSPVGTN